MSVIRGRVLEIMDRHVIVLTDDCQYLKVARPGGQLRKGAAIEVRQQRKTKAYLRAAAFSLAAALLIILFIPNLNNLLIPAPTAAYGAVALDINPAIEFTFDRDLRVLNVRAINSEGEYLLEDIEQGMDLYEALARALDKALHYGYLSTDKEDNALMLTLVGGSKTDSLLDDLETNVLDKLKSMNLKGFLFAHQAGWKERDKAFKDGMSLNRLLLKDLLQTSDVNGLLLDLLIEAGSTSNISLRQIIAEPQNPNAPIQDPGKPNDNNNNQQPRQDNNGNPVDNSPIKDPPKEGIGGTNGSGSYKRP